MLGLAQDLDILHEESHLFHTPEEGGDGLMDVHEAVFEQDPFDQSPDAFQDATVDLEMSAAAAQPLAEASAEKEGAQSLATPAQRELYDKVVKHHPGAAVIKFDQLLAEPKDEPMDRLQVTQLFSELLAFQKVKASAPSSDIKGLGLLQDQRRMHENRFDRAKMFEN